MTDHAKTIRDALMWAQAYAPDRLAHRLIDAEESLRELLAGHAAEVEQLRGYRDAFRSQGLPEDCPVDRFLQHHTAQLRLAAEADKYAAELAIERMEQAERERDEARADAETLRQERDDAVEAAAILWTYYLLVLPPEKHARVRDLMGRIEARIAALAAAQEPPHCKCHSSWPSDLRCPSCESAAQEQEYTERMTCPRCEQYGDGCNCAAQEPLARPANGRCCDRLDYRPILGWWECPVHGVAAERDE